MERLVSISLKCPHCRQSLMDEGHMINEKPSVKLNIEAAGKKGELYLCSLYGCLDKESTIDVPEGEIATLSCPHCGENLATNVPCEACDAPMVTFGIATGGRVSICSRKGCGKHYVAFQNLDDAVRRFHEEFDRYS